MSLFSKPDKPDFNFDKNVGPDFLRFLTRMEDIEKKSRKLANSLSVHSLDWDTKVSVYRRSINDAKKDIEYINNSVSQIKKDFMNIVMEFKLVAHEEEFYRLNKKVDQWNIDEFITKDEFLRLLKERFKEQS